MPTTCPVCFVHYVRSRFLGAGYRMLARFWRAKRVEAQQDLDHALAQERHCRGLSQAHFYAASLVTQHTPSRS